ncbi:hypothetical protein Q7P35_003010 [Cladosporium inversicolor]
MAKRTSITVYSLSDPSSANPILAKVLEHLRQPAYFKTALALYRRLQFGRFLESSYLYTNLRLESSGGLDTASDNEQPWFYAFIDRGCRPETEVWIFGSWEVETQQHSNGLSNGSGDQPPFNETTATKEERIRTLLLDLIHMLQSEAPPPSIHPDDAVLTAHSQIATKDASRRKPPSSAAQLTNPATMLWGAVHAATTARLQALDLPATHLLPVMPNHTFVFPISALPEPAPLPPTLRWGKLQKQHFPLVRSRTEIARQDFTLARLPNLAIFPVEPADAAPVAWAFVGLDGSLTTLHTETLHRRMGLAMALTAKLFREEMGFFWEEGVERLALGNVAVGNEASASMCRRLGGEDIGEVFWLRVDLRAKSRAAANGV